MKAKTNKPLSLSMKILEKAFYSVLFLGSLIGASALHDWLALGTFLAGSIVSYMVSQDKD